MSRWWRAEDTSIDHPKLLLLSDAMHRAWYTLMCVASANGGALPPVEHIAARLRMKPGQVAAWITHLVSAGLFDNDDGIFRPHNWNKRQYKTDVTDTTNAERQKRYRNKHRNGSNGDSNAVTVKRPETETETEDTIVEARPGASMFTEGSKVLADAFLEALGFDTPLKVPLEFAGISWRAVTWETAGWTADLIAADAKRIGPDKPLTYYEKVFATSFAKRQAPLPVVEVRDAEQLKVTRHGRPEATENLSAVARRHAESGIAFGERPTTPSLCVVQGGVDVRLLPQGGSERPGDLRGSDGGGIERIPAGSG